MTCIYTPNLSVDNHSSSANSIFCTRRAFLRGFAVGCFAFCTFFRFIVRPPAGPGPLLISLSFSRCTSASCARSAWTASFGCVDAERWPPTGVFPPERALLIPSPPARAAGASGAIVAGVSVGAPLRRATGS